MLAVIHLEDGVAPEIGSQQLLETYFIVQCSFLIPGARRRGIAGALGPAVLEILIERAECLQEAQQPVLVRTVLSHKVQHLLLVIRRQRLIQKTLIDRLRG